MSDPRIERIGALLERFSDGDLGAVDELVAPRFFVHVPQVGEPSATEVYRGYAAELKDAFPDLRIAMPDLAPLKFDEQYPLWLVTGEMLFHSRDGTRTMYSRTLMKAANDGQVAMNPFDAGSLSLKDGDLASFHSAIGSLQARVTLSKTTPRGSLVAMIGPSLAPCGLFAMADRDPQHGTPNMHRTAVRVEAADER